jgi:hypothetical protein
MAKSFLTSFITYWNAPSHPPTLFLETMSVTVTRLLLAALAATGSLASPTVKRQTACTAPKQRRAW